MALTLHSFWAHIPTDNDIRIQTREVEFMNVLMQPTAGANVYPPRSAAHRSKSVQILFRETIHDWHVT